jgi:ABC-type Mn2+/Zn2+ transport system ATPase subunit
LQSTVDGINRVINIIASQIFPFPITILLQLVKMLKTDHRMTQQVNFLIQYQGNEIDGVRQLSGGEADRVSFATLIALSLISESPLLLLDEPFSALDVDVRDQCLKAIREMIRGKTVICVNHEDTEGNYDYSVCLE